MFGSQSQSRMIPVVLFFVFIFLTACAGRGGAPQADSQPAVSDPPLTQKYANIIVYEFKTTPEIKKDYPDAARECQVNVITDLQIKNVYNSVAAYKPGAAYGTGRYGRTYLGRGICRQFVHEYGRNFCQRRYQSGSS